MSDKDDPTHDGVSEPGKSPIALSARLEDLGHCDVEYPIMGSSSADCHELGRLYREASALNSELGPEAESVARIFALLDAVLGFHFKPSEREEPFGPRIVMDGRRSAVPEDFLGEPLTVLASVAEQVKHPTLKARLCDLCWYVDKRQHKLGRAAAASYLEIIDRLASGTMQCRSGGDSPQVGLTSRDYLLRALTIARSFGQNSEEFVSAKDRLRQISAQAFSGNSPVAVKWFSELSLNYDAIAPNALASEIELWLKAHAPESDMHAAIDLWRLAARAFRIGKDEPAEHRCRRFAAELFASEAEKQTSSMLASHWLSDAIAEYHGIPGAAERRKELRHRLVDVQSGIPDELSSFSHPIDLTEIVRDTEERILQHQDLLGQLFEFANLTRSPDLHELAEEAREAIAKFPLSSLMSRSVHDHEGKVIHRTIGSVLTGDADSEVVRNMIAEHEQVRRYVASVSGIEVGRQKIVEMHPISEETMVALLRHSPFVPARLVSTYSRALSRFFQGDYTSALYTLVPLLEASIRYILKQAGHEVTRFDVERQTQQDRSISSIFDGLRPELADIFGEAIVGDIVRLFLEKPGPSIRHDVAHGLLHDGSPFGADAIYACWLIFRLCCIPLFGKKEHISLPA